MLLLRWRHCRRCYFCFSFRFYLYLASRPETAAVPPTHRYPTPAESATVPPIPGVLTPTIAKASLPVAATLSNTLARAAIPTPATQTPALPIPERSARHSRLPPEQPSPSAKDQEAKAKATITTKQKASFHPQKSVITLPPRLYSRIIAN